MEFFLINIFFIINNKIIQKYCCEPEIKKGSDEKIDEILDKYLVHRKKEEKKKEGRNKLISGRNLLYNDLYSINNHIGDSTYENSKINYINNNNYYLLHSQNNNCFGFHTKSSESFSNDFNNNTQKNALLLKKKNNKKKLKLKNILGNLFKENFIITINEYGIESFTPLRRKYDRITKFGPIGYDKEGKPINDFQIIISDKFKDKIDTLFFIEYNAIKQNYFLVPNYFEENQELNIFIKLEEPLPISQNYSFSLGDAHFSVEPKPGGALELEMNMENGERESYLFGIAKEVVKIGRCKSCDINLKSLAYSRIQTCLYYKKEEKIWYIKDGYNEKKSMNGTWLYINFPWEISLNTKLRVGQNLLEMNITI